MQTHARKSSENGERINIYYTPVICNMSEVSHLEDILHVRGKCYTNFEKTCTRWIRDRYVKSIWKRYYTVC
jgi:hypothetical protein